MSEASGKGKASGKGEARAGKGEGAARVPSRGRSKAKPKPAARSSSAPGRPKPAGNEAGNEEAEPAAVRASSQSSRRPNKRSSAPRLNWDHPEGRKFEDLQVDTALTGVVVNVSDYGVFVDIGYERNVLIACQRRYWRRFRRGDILEDLKVVSVDLEKRRASVGLEDPEVALAENRIPLEELKEGSYINGVVDQKNQYGVFVNIGSDICHGRLNAPRFLCRQLQKGQVLRDLCIASLDVENTRVSLLLDDIDGAIEEMEMVSVSTMLGDPASKSSKPKEVPTPAKAKPKAKAKAKASEPEEDALVATAVAQVPPPPPEKGEGKGKGKGKGKAKTKAKAEEEEEDDSGLEMGALVDGIVVSISGRGVHVDIGKAKKGLLEVPADLKEEFQKGDRVQGMKVEKISPSGVATLSMDDPELEVDDVPPKSSAKARGKSKAKGKGKTKTKEP